jgi:hypothetical protein
MIVAEITDLLETALMEDSTISGSCANQKRPSSC